MSLQVVLKLGIITWYTANKAYVAAKLCENRDKPQMKCCGKCYLNKQLKKTEQHGNTGNSSKSQEKDVDLFIVTQAKGIEFASDALLKMLVGYYRAPLGYAYHPFVFHPPAVTCL